MCVCACEYAEVPETPDPLLLAWGLGIRWLRLHHDAHGNTLEDGAEPMTQAQMGDSLDPPVSQGCVAKWEAGLREPKRRYKKQIADLFEVPQATIFVNDPTQASLTQLPMPTRSSRTKAVA